MTSLFEHAKEAPLRRTSTNKNEYMGLTEHEEVAGGKVEAAAGALLEGG